MPIFRKTFPAISWATFSADGTTATVTVPAAASAFIKAVVGVAAPSE